MYICIQVPKVSVDLAIKSWPLLLGCSVGKLKVMVEQFGELGVRNKKLGRVMTRSPQLLLRKPQEVLQVSTRNSFSVSSFYVGKSFPNTRKVLCHHLCSIVNKCFQLCNKPNFKL